MDVLRVFNNNVVLAKDGNSEVILTGRGIGFQAKPGQHVDDAKIVRRFVPADGKDPDHMAQQVAGIPPEIIRLVTDAMNRTGLKEQADRLHWFWRYPTMFAVRFVDRKTSKQSNIHWKPKCVRSTRVNTPKAKLWSMR